MRTVYLDHAATTPIDGDVLSHMQPYWGKEYGNPSSMHRSGWRAAHAQSEARDVCASCIHAYPDEIIFTGSGTESDNLAILGTAHAYASRGRHIVISAIEHKAVQEATQILQREGFEISVAPVDAYGMIDIPTLTSLVRDDTILVSAMLANNEIGTIEPIAELADSLRERRNKTGLPLLHTDACQAGGYVSLDVEALGIDLMTQNGSKVYGPKGIGLLYKRRGVRLSPLLVGGGQEHGLRAGTESVTLIMGFAYALLKAEELREHESLRLRSLRNYFIRGLQNAVPGVMINGHPEHVLPHIVHITVPGIEGESMVLMLDEQGIEVATGSACSAHDLKPSHVMSAIGQPSELIHGSLRFSMGRETTEEELEYVLRVFPSIVRRLTEISALTTTHYAHAQ